VSSDTVGGGSQGGAQSCYTYEYDAGIKTIKDELPCPSTVQRLEKRIYEQPCGMIRCNNSNSPRT